MSECGLYIPPELLKLNLSPIETMVAAEVAQFKKCNAHYGHFQRRFGVSKNTIINAVKLLCEKDILEVNGEIKSVKIRCSKIPNSGTVVPKTGIPKIERKVPNFDRKIPNSGSPSEQEVTRSNKKDKSLSLSPEILPLAETMARIRFETAGLKKQSSNAVSYYGALIKKLIADGETDLADIEILIRWLDKTPRGRECFGYGMGNMPRGYSHVFIRNFAANLAAAKKHFGTALSAQGGSIKWPGSLIQRNDPKFNPGPGWKLETYVTKRKFNILGVEQETETTNYEWVRSE